MTVSDLNYPLAEVAVLIQKGSHTPDSCVPLKYQQLCGMIPYQDASKQGKLDLPAFLPAFDQSCSTSKSPFGERYKTGLKTEDSSQCYVVCNITNTTAFLTQVHSPHGCLNINILSESRSVGASEIHLCGNIVKHAERTSLAVQETFLLQGVGAELGEFSHWGY